MAKTAEDLLSEFERMLQSYSSKYLNSLKVDRDTVVIDYHTRVIKFPKLNKGKVSVLLKDYQKGFTFKNMNFSGDELTIFGDFLYYSPALSDKNIKSIIFKGNGSKGKFNLLSAKPQFKRPVRLVFTNIIFNEDFNVKDIVQSKNIALLQFHNCKGLSFKGIKKLPDNIKVHQCYDVKGVNNIFRFNNMKYICIKDTKVLIPEDIIKMDSLGILDLSSGFYDCQKEEITNYLLKNKLDKEEKIEKVLLTKQFLSLLEFGDE